jgi:uncharacterized protein YoaH (UPF0181 family)
MGLDTRAFARMTHEERQQWVDEMNDAGQKPAPGILGAFAAVKLEQLATLDDAPFWDQPERISQLDWPGGLIGGMMSGCGDGPSFRGKAYDAYVEEVTGRSLYEAAEGMWEGETLVEVAKALREAATFDRRSARRSPGGSRSASRTTWASAATTSRCRRLPGRHARTGLL